MTFVGTWDIDNIDTASTTTSTTEMTFYTSPVFDIPDWEEIRIEKERKIKESNTVHLQEKRKDLFR